MRKVPIPSDFKYFPCPTCLDDYFSGQIAQAYSLVQQVTWQGQRAYECPRNHICTHSYMVAMLKKGDGKMKAKLAIIIDDGVHNGTISDVLERTKPYEYTDIITKIPVEDQSEPVELKYGCPSSISYDKDGNGTTQLSKLLAQFGMTIKVGDDVTVDDIKKALVGKKVKLMTETETTEKGKFAKIVSFKPA